MRSSRGWESDSLKRPASLAIALGAIACAQQEMPPGGPNDVRPPVVVATSPAALETVTDLDTEIRFEFDERISERVAGGTLETAILVSPTAGVYEVSHGRQSLSVKVEGGLRPGLVYRVTLTPTVTDLFGNVITDPFELVFSTGGEPVPTTLAGEVWDRITGRPVSEAVLLAVDEDSLVHRSSSDRDGIFAFRYLTAGMLDVIAFQDQNRNGEADSTEVQGVAPLSIAAGDTVLLEIPILTPDTSAANVTGTDVVDSTTVAILFDDFLDFDSRVENIDVTLVSDSVEAPAVIELMHETAYIEWVEMVTDSFARLDSIESEERAAAAAAEAAARATADSAAELLADTVAAELLADAVEAEASVLEAPRPGVRDDSIAPSDTVVMAQVGAGAPETRPGTFASREPPPSLPRLEGSTAGPTSDGRRVLPGRRLVLRVGGPIPFGVEFAVTVAGVTNIFGLPGGGGETTLLRELVLDSAAILDSMTQADSAAALDTGTVGDTGVVSSGNGGAAPWATRRR